MGVGKTRHLFQARRIKRKEEWDQLFNEKTQKGTRRRRYMMATEEGEKEKQRGRTMEHTGTHRELRSGINKAGGQGRSGVVSSERPSQKGGGERRKSTKKARQGTNKGNGGYKVSTVA